MSRSVASARVAPGVGSRGDVSAAPRFNGRPERRTEDPAPGVRRSARTLHAACAELLPGYAAASREP
jgi:hypothetical protein